MCIEGKGSVWKESAVYERKWMCMKGREFYERKGEV